MLSANNRLVHESFYVNVTIAINLTLLELCTMRLMVWDDISHNSVQGQKFMDLSQGVVWLSYILFIHPMDGPCIVSTFWPFWIVLLGLFVYRFCLDVVFISYLRSGISRWYGDSVFNSLGSHYLVFHGACSVFYPQSQGVRAPVSSHPCRHVCCCVCICCRYHSYLSRREAMSHCAFNWPFPND